MERCPGCNARVNETLTCPRCKADLKFLVEIEEAAKTWLRKAIDFYSVEQIEQSIRALNFSIFLQKFDLALNFRDYLIERQSEEVLGLLSEKKLLKARQQLYYLRSYVPVNKKLCELQKFSDYLLAKQRKSLVSKLSTPP